MSIAEQPTRETWLAERLTGIGASESACIFGVGYETNLELWGRKTGRITESKEATDAMLIGNLIQPALVAIAREFIGGDVVGEPEFTVRRHPLFPWIMASLDARIDRPRLIPWELKNVGHYLAADWDEAAPLKFQIQCQHQMLVTGASESVLMGLIGGNKVKWHGIQRNDEFIDKTLFPALKEFWACVTEDREPQPVGDPVKIVKALAKLHPLDNGETCELPSDADEWLTELEAAKDRAKQAELDVDTIKAKLLAELGDETYGVTPTGRYCSWKTQERKSYTVEAGTSRVFRTMTKPPKK